MLTNASKYAIRSVLYLAKKRTSNQKYGAIEISKELNIPKHFIAKLLQNLAKENIISSSKGPNGGFYMTEKNLENNICDVIEVTDSLDMFDNCFLGLHKCNDESPCPVHTNYKAFKSQLLEQFKSQTIKEFTIEIEKNGTFLAI